MLRFASIAMGVISLLLIGALVHAAPNKPPQQRSPQQSALVVEISAIQSDAKATTQALNEIALPPKDAKPSNSIKALVGKDGAFLAEASVGDRVIRLSGKVKTSDDAYSRVSMDYSDKSPVRIQSITSLVMLKTGETKPLGGLTSGEFRSILVFTLREDKPAAE